MQEFKRGNLLVYLGGDESVVIKKGKICEMLGYTPSGKYCLVEVDNRKLSILTSCLALTSASIPTPEEEFLGRIKLWNEAEKAIDNYTADIITAIVSFLETNRIIGPFDQICNIRPSTHKPEESIECILFIRDQKNKYEMTYHQIKIEALLPFLS